MREWFKARTRGQIDMAKVVGGTFTRNLLRGLFKLLVAGILAPQAMGIVRAVFSFFKIVTSLVEFGLDATMVTFVSRAVKCGDAAERDRTLRLVLGLKMLTSLLLVIVGNVFAGPITNFVFSDPSLTIFTRLVFLAVGGQLLWRYIHSFLGACQRFGRLALYLTTVPLLMLIAGLLLAPAGALSSSTAILIYLLAPGITAALWWAFAGSGFARLPAWNRAVAGKILRFSRWIYVTNVASATRGNVNPLLLKNPGLSGSLTAGEINAGLYGFGSDMANEITVLSQSLLTVLLPKASSKSTPDKLRRFVKRTYLYLVPAMVPLVLVVFLAQPALLLLGSLRANFLEYLPSLKIFAILYWSLLFSVAAMPMQTALYAMKLPQIESYIEMTTTVILIVLSILLIPRFGGEGAAIAVFVQRAITFALFMVFGLTRLRKLESLG